jgi:hypothetical protein
MVGLALSSVTAAACEKPAEPAIPTGEAASGSDMLEAKKAVEAFLKDAEAYLECARGGIAKDRMVADMEEVADKFNRELRAYKAKS